MPPSRRSTRTVSSTSARESAQPYTRTNTRTSPNASRSSATIARPANGKTSLRLTVKAPPSKLRQATSGSQIPPNPYADNSESDATPAPPPRPSRATRNPRTIVDPDSDEDEDDAEGEEEEDAEGEVDQELLANEDDSEEDADGEDDEMDELQRDHPPPPVLKQHRVNGQARSNFTITAPNEGPLKSVEDKEMEDDDDDDELSELEDLDELEPDNEEEHEEEEEEDDEEGSNEDDNNSRSATPDLSKLTKRQRGAFAGTVEFDGGLMALSNEALKKTHLTEEEHAMRRQEMARRRKNLSEKRNEEEKMDTINKLLSKPAPKRRTRAEMQALRAAGEAGDEEDQDKPEPAFTRWVNTKEGSRLGVPTEWMDAPIGNTFRSGGGRMVEEVA